MDKKKRPVLTVGDTVPEEKTPDKLEQILAELRSTREELGAVRQRLTAMEGKLPTAKQQEVG